MCITLRITSAMDDTVRSSDTHFLKSLFASSPLQLAREMCHQRTTVFDSEMMFVPFEACGHKSLFVIIGAGNISEYTKRGFKGSRPCILHLDPVISRCGRHDHHAVGEKLRLFLNTSWRRAQNVSDPLIMPFNKRSMPVCRPNREYERKKLTCYFHCHWI